MTKTLPLIMVILVVLVVAFLYFDGAERLPASLDDATRAERCELFRAQIESENDDDYSIGYGGRIRMLFKGCF